MVSLAIEGVRHREADADLPVRRDFADEVSIDGSAGERGSGEQEE